MQFVTSRSEALDKLNKFIESDISNYNTKRNFDFGVKNRNNVSCLSPYITHRLISEYETIKKVLLSYFFKFIVLNGFLDPIVINDVNPNSKNFHIISIIF